MTSNITGQAMALCKEPQSQQSQPTTSSQSLTLEDLAAIVTSGFKDMNTSIDTKFFSFEQKIVTKFNNLEKETGKLSKKIDAVEDRCEKIERLLLLTDLIVHGIPYNKDEILKDIFNSICATINYNLPIYALQAIFRAVPKKDSALIIKFISSSTRNDFYFTYLKAKNLFLKDIGFDSSVRFFIKESLTKKNAQIFRECMARKKNKEIFNAYTRNGSIFIKPTEQSQPILINSILQLTGLLIKNNTGSTSDALTDGVTHHKRKPSASPKAFSTPKNNKKHRRTSTQILKAGVPRASEPSDDCSSDLSDTLVAQNTKPRRKNSVGPLDQFVTIMD